MALQVNARITAPMLGRRSLAAWASGATDPCRAWDRARD
jgi:hypothetical protein